jgi:hypothetical protein
VKRSLLIGAAALGAVLVARRFARGRASFNFEKMITRMPEDSPPKWMFRNVTAIRENTERILELVEAERTPAGERVRTAA